MTVRQPTAKDASGSHKKLLCVRMTALGLDIDAVASSDRALFETLQDRCSHCEFPDGCAHDLRDDPNNPVWEAYCPNSATLTRLSGA